MDEPSQPDHPWTVRALRGSAVRCAVFGSLAGLAGALASAPQALSSFGLCAGVAAAVTFGERWLTRNGPVSALPAIAGGVAAWVVITAGLVLFCAEVQVGFGALTWAQGPAVANEALLLQMGETGLGVVVLLAFCTSPLLLTVASHVNSWSALEAVGPTLGSSAVLSAFAGVFTYAVSAQDMLAFDALATGAAGLAVAWIYLAFGSWIGLFALASTELLEAWAFGSPVVRWSLEAEKSPRPGRELNASERNDCA